MKVELIYDEHCPNVEIARRRLAKAMQNAGPGHNWIEWNQADAASPEYTRRFGSPTVLVDGRDVAGCSPGEAEGSCRLYRSVNGWEGAPAIETIASALSQAAAHDASSGTSVTTSM